MSGDLREVSIMKEAIADGLGGEVDGLAIRVWIDDEANDGDYALALTVLLPDRADAWHTQAREIIDDALRILELER